MITQAQVLEVSVKAGLAKLPEREFRFYSIDFVEPVAPICLTVVLFAPVASDSLARLWSDACFVHSENLCESWSKFREGFKDLFAVQELTTADFVAESGKLVDALHPLLAAAVAEIRSVGLRVHDGMSISSGDGLRSLVGICADCAVVLVWTETRKPTNS